MFEPLPPRFGFPEAELKVLDFWRRHDIFGKSLEMRRGAPRFVFYEGPPTANGLPHPGHCLTRAIKDLFPRYQTMCGRLVERKAGWDTHGLPVEIEVCKQLGINTKKEIEAYGLDKFVQRCIESVFTYVREWEQMTDRLGFWINLADAYVTYHQSYVESVWWSLKTLFERGLLYQGHKVVWWWAQGGTALSAGEVGEGYRTVRDPSVYLRFPLRADVAADLRVGRPEETANGERRTGNSKEGAGAGPVPCSLIPDPSKRVSLLVWTTTPWTLVSNHFCAVGPDIDYALVYDKTADEYLVIAAALVQDVANKVKHDLEQVGGCKGSELVGLRYVPPFDCYCQLMKDQTARRTDGREEVVGWRVLPADFVALDTGTGLVHQAPAYGEVDFNLLQEERRRFADFDAIPLINAVAPDGTFTDEAPPQYRGRWVKDCDAEIMEELNARGVLYHQEMIEHEYPFCPRSEDDPLIQYARKSWFVRTSQFRDEFLNNNAEIYWLPEHIREGRFGDFLRNNVDWALSRERYWGTPLPIWVCEKTGRMEAIGSYAELLAKPGVQGTEVWEQAKAANPNLPEHLKVHKPYIDAITYDSPFVEETGNGKEGLRDSGIDGPEEREREAGTREEGTGERESQVGPDVAAGPRTGRSVAALRASRQAGGLRAGRPRMRRVPEVIDCWWDAGSMPFAQWGFPHVPASVDTFVNRFPCDFISEAIDQTRGWFYGLLAISTLLFSKGSAGVSPAHEGSAGVSPAHEGSAGVPPAHEGSAGVSPAREGSAGVSPAPSERAAARRPVTEDLQQRRRRSIPHWETGGSTYFVTFSTATTGSPQKRDELTFTERDVVLRACRYWDGDRLLLHAAVVMPDHVHLLLTPQEKQPGEWWSIADLMHSIKSYSAKEINRLRGRTGRVWQPEYYDRIIRTLTDFEEKWEYVVTNAQRKGLGDDYPWVWVEPSYADGTAGGVRGGRDAHPPQILTPVARRYPHPYRACIVLGHVMGEDGLKMSKRTKNYKEPSYIFDTYGADAMRWFFFSAQTPWTSIRFQEAAIRDAQRDFLLRLYNVFSFFNIYANIDGFEVRHAGAEAQRHEGTGWRPVGRRCELDRWIISELNHTIRFVRQKMDAFENYPAAGRLKEFVDALSNWYVRRSRERFWRPLQKDARADQDKWDAYNTLYEVLDTLSKLLAPFTPFLAETMYQNLAGIGEQGEGNGEAGSGRALPFPISVHLCDYPVADESLIDDKLATEMNLVRQLVSLGRAARTEAKLKVRQPLARAEIILARREHADWLQAHADLIAEELNIKQVEFATEPDRYVTYQIKPEFKALGPKFGKLAPRIADALGRMDAARARQTLATTGELTVEVDGQRIRLSSHDVHVRLEARPGWSAAQGRAGVVVVQTELTPALKEEGLIRELIHLVQGLRRDEALPYEARIRVYVDGAAELLATVRRLADTIMRECLALEIVYGDGPAGIMRAVKIDSQAARLGIERL